MGVGVNFKNWGEGGDFFFLNGGGGVKAHLSGGTVENFGKNLSLHVFDRE